MSKLSFYHFNELAAFLLFLASFMSKLSFYHFEPF